MRIIKGNVPQQKINLKGLLVGDAWVNPRLQQSANADFAYAHGLVDKQGQKQANKSYQ